MTPQERAPRVVTNWIWWGVLALPAPLIVAPLVAGAPWRAAIGPSGQVAALLLAVALGIGPLNAVGGGRRPTAWLLARRRHLGVASFLYALLHLAVFLPAVGRADWILQGMAYATMWTGWLAMLALTVVAAASNPPAERRLGRAWKPLQRLAWLAALLALAHWFMLARQPVQAIALASAVGLLQAARLWKRRTGA